MECRYESSASWNVSRPNYAKCMVLSLLPGEARVTYSWARRGGATEATISTAVVVVKPCGAGHAVASDG